MPRWAPVFFLVLTLLAADPLSALAPDSNGYGVSFGNSKMVKGLRLNLVDEGVEKIVGLNLNGITLSGGGISVRAGEIRGAASSLILVKARRLQGFSAGAVNFYDDIQVGFTLGIFNYAKELHGIHLGLINIARNNPAHLQVLPILNAHFDR